MLQARKEVVEVLNKHFKTAVLEKHPEAMIQLFIDDAYKAVCGSDYHKKKISARDRERIRQHILKNLRIRYGKWISIVDFDKKFSFRTNFEFTYKTAFGRLYGSSPKSGFGNLFFTTHSLEQFDERVPPDKLRDFSLAHKQEYGADPTAADTLLFFILTCFQFGIYRNFIYLVVNYGILVIEVLDAKVLLAKTFLAPDMLDFSVKWYILKSDVDRATFSLLEFINKLDEVADPIEKPVFDIQDLDYAFFRTIMKRSLI